MNSSDAPAGMFDFSFPLTKGYGFQRLKEYAKLLPVAKQHSETPGHTQRYRWYSGSSREARCELETSQTLLCTSTAQGTRTHQLCHRIGYMLFSG